MWRNSTCLSLILLALASATGLSQSFPAQSFPTQPQATSAALPEPIATRQTLFSIPFHVEQPASPAQTPVETQLFVSGDRGANWHLYGKADPRQQHFMFRAGGDGEYWFAVRTLDRSGQLHPATIAGPGLRVVVDTELPKLGFEAERAATGQITAKWQIDEPHVNLDTLVVQFRVSDIDAWQRVAIDRRRIQTAQSHHSGEVTWLAPATDQPIQVRAEVTDMAGNKAVNQARLEPRRTSDLLSHTAERSPSPPTDPRSSVATTPWPADYATSSALPHHRAAQPPVEQLLVAQPPTMPNRAMTATANPPIRSRFEDPTGLSNNPSNIPNGATPINMPPSAPFTPQQPRPLMVNSRLLELDYDVTSAGPSGIARVELWATQDGGQTWRSIALDDDTQSPIVAKVDSEGVYGFRVAVSSGAGLGGEAPRSGDLPEIEIGVDLTEPAARILAVEPGVGRESGSLIITWQAADTWLARQPISLLWSQTPAGPWNPIAQNLENTGRHAWPIGQPLSRGVYLRIEARDEAGNIGAFQTAQPISGNRAQPAGSIRGVQPLGRSPQTNASQHYWR